MVPSKESIPAFGRKLNKAVMFLRLQSTHRLVPVVVGMVVVKWRL